MFRSDRRWEIHGRSRDDHGETSDVWRRWTHPEDLTAMDAQLQEVFARTAPTFRIAGRTRHREGHLIPVVVRGFVEYDDAGQPIRMSGATTDVTDAERAQAMKDEFVSTVSHELRTPLTSIGGSLEMLSTGRAGRLPERADRSVEMRMRIVGDRVRTEVIDRGPGVPADFADRLFDRFAPADPADGRSRGGTGLGLAISRESVSRLDGTVGYDSEPGLTSFWVDLPIVGD